MSKPCHRSSHRNASLFLRERFSLIYMKCIGTLSLRYILSLKYSEGGPVGDLFRITLTVKKTIRKPHWGLCTLEVLSCEHTASQQCHYLVLMKKLLNLSRNDFNFSEISINIIWVFLAMNDVYKNVVLFKVVFLESICENQYWIDIIK